VRWSYVATMSLESAVTASVALAQDANGRQLLPGRTGVCVRMPSCALDSTLPLWLTFRSHRAMTTGARRATETGADPAGAAAVGSQLDPVSG